MVKWAFNPDKEVHFDTSVKAAVSRYYPLFDGMVKAGGWMVEDDSATIADVLVAEMLHEYGLMHEERGVADPVDDYPKLKGLIGRVVEMEGVKAYLSSNRRFPFPAEGQVCDEYVRNVNTVLGRI